VQDSRGIGFFDLCAAGREYSPNCEIDLVRAPRSRLHSVDVRDEQISKTPLHDRIEASRIEIRDLANQ